MTDPRLERIRSNFAFFDHSDEELEEILSRFAGDLHLTVLEEPAGWHNLILGEAPSLVPFHRRRNPFGEWQELLQNEEKEPEILVCFGTGFAYQLPSVIPALQSCRRSFIVENRLEALFVFLSELDLSRFLPPHVRIIFAEEPADLARRIQKYCRRYHPSNIRFLPLESAAILCPDYLPQTVESINDSWQRHMVYLTSLEEQHGWLSRNALGNLARTGDAGRLAEGCGAGRHGLIVASGPSLTAALPFIHSLRDRVTIMAVGSAFNPLLRAGIQPDLVIVNDPQPINLKHFPEPAYAVPLAYDPCVPPEIVEKFTGEKLLFHSGHAIVEVFAEDLGLAQIRNWGTVTSAALSLATAAGFRDIGIIGADFAFHGDQMHTFNYRVRASVHHAAPATDNLGLPMRTTPTLEQYAGFVTRQIEEFEEAGAIIINLCEGGLLRAGSMLSLADYHHRLCEDEAADTPMRWTRPLPAEWSLASSANRFRDLLGQAMQAVVLMKNGEITINEFASQTMIASYEGQFIDRFRELEAASMAGDTGAVQRIAESIAIDLKAAVGEFSRRLFATV
jgi:hypothetical protein